jgi:hypothetical protein
VTRRLVAMITADAMTPEQMKTAACEAIQAYLDANPTDPSPSVANDTP